MHPLDPTPVASGGAVGTPTRAPRLAVQIRPEAVRSIFEEARARLPEESCGLLLGTRRDDVVAVERAVATENTSDADRRDSYEVDRRAYIAEERRGSDPIVVGAFHSHPEGPPIPSASDTSRAWPGLIYFIAGRSPARDPVLRCFLSTATGFVELNWSEGAGGIR